MPLRPVRPPKARSRRPRFRPPAGACDTHFHIYGPFDRFPLRAPVEDRSYTPTEGCTYEDYCRLQAVTGFERGVIVTGNPNGRYNNDVTLDAIAHSGGRLKGLAYMDSDIPEAALRRLAEGGMTGYRIRPDRRKDDFRGDAERSADRVRDFGWHVEVHIDTVEEAVEMLRWLPSLRLPYVLDHCARAKPERGVDDPAFLEVLGHLRDRDDCWVNLYSYYQLSRDGAPGYADVIPIVARLVETRPDRLLWGSNWPHAVPGPTPDDGDLVDFIPAAIPDPAHRQAVLVDNPARLYGWV